MIRLFRLLQHLIDNDAACANGDKTVGEIEHGEGPGFRVEEDIVDHMDARIEGRRRSSSVA